MRCIDQLAGTAGNVAVAVGLVNGFLDGERGVNRGIEVDKGRSLPVPSPALAIIASPSVILADGAIHGFTIRQYFLRKLQNLPLVELFVPGGANADLILLRQAERFADGQGPDECQAHLFAASPHGEDIGT